MNIFMILLSIPYTIFLLFKNLLIGICEMIKELLNDLKIGIKEWVKD